MMLAAQVAAGGAVGFAVGLVFFHALRRNTALYLEAGPAWRPVGLHLARISLLSAVLVGVVLGAGGAGLVAAFVGVLLARAVALRTEGGRP